MYKISRYWNRIVYFVIRKCQGLIWDQTGMNEALLTNEDFGSTYSEDIFCDKK